MSPYTIDFKRLMQANADAFDAMGNIRQKAVEPGDSDLHKLLETSFSNVVIMAREYIKTYPEQQNNIKNVFSNAYANACYVVDQLQGMKNNGKENSEEYFKLLDDKYEKGLFKLVDSLGTEFEEKKEGIDINAVKTLHELIRYLHQGTIEMTFDARKLKDTSSDLYSFCLNNGTFYFMDLDNQIAAKNKSRGIEREQILCRPVQAILDFYAQNIRTAGSETFYIFLKKDAINAHVKINCHSAEIDAKLNGDTSFVKLRYNEYLNANFLARISYLSNAMKYLGFDVKVASKELKEVEGSTCDVKTNAIVAEKKNVDEKSACGTLTELVRLLASSTDINCSLSNSENKKYSTNDLLKVFFESKYTNLHGDLFHGDETRSEIDKKLKKFPVLQKVVKNRLKELKITK